MVKVNPIDINAIYNYEDEDSKDKESLSIEEISPLNEGEENALIKERIRIWQVINEWNVVVKTYYNKNCVINWRN